MVPTDGARETTNAVKQSGGLHFNSTSRGGLVSRWHTRRHDDEEAAMRYERPSVQERRTITAELSQACQTSMGATYNPTWRRPEGAE